MLVRSTILPVCPKGWRVPPPRGRFLRAKKTPHIAAIDQSRGERHVELPGQRLLILVSPGFLSVAPDAMTFKSELLDQAAAANVIISALDARGLYLEVQTRAGGLAPP